EVAPQQHTAAPQAVAPQPPTPSSVAPCGSRLRRHNTWRRRAEAHMGLGRSFVCASHRLRLAPPPAALPVPCRRLRPAPPPPAALPVPRRRLRPAPPPPPPPPSHAAALPYRPPAAPSPTTAAFSSLLAGGQ
ncbi:hypothetical protein U9M48_033070, partial [Paspalum notatum var. saurae]